ncbi:hypothetical protein [Arthrobacter sp. Z1-9]
MKTTKRLFWTLATTLGIAAATAGPALAGLQTNHTERLAGR